MDEEPEVELVDRSCAACDDPEIGLTMANIPNCVD
jgi:hypothetical protein